MINSDSKTPKIQILNRPEPKQQVLKNSESDVLNPKFQRKKTIVASWDPKPKVIKPKVLSEQKPPNFKHKDQKKKSKTSSTNPKGPIKIWVPKSEIVNAADMPKSKGKSQVMVPGQWCSRHMTGEKSMFLTLTMKEGGTVGFGGNQTGKIIGT